MISLSNGGRLRFMSPLSLSLVKPRLHVHCCNIVRRTHPNIVIRMLLTMLDTHITLLETRHFSHNFNLCHFGLLMVLRLETGPLNLIGLFVERAAPPSTLCCMLEKMFLIEIQTFFRQKTLNKHHQTCMLQAPRKYVFGGQLQNFLVSDTP